MRFLITIVGASTLTTLLPAQNYFRTDAGIEFYDKGLPAYLIAGCMAPLFGKDPNRINQSILTTLAMGSAWYTNEAGLKWVFLEKRPDSKRLDSFPATTALTTFTIAAMQSTYRPQEAWYWYTGAAVLSVARQQQGRHYIHDIVAGAGIGYLWGRWIASEPRFNMMPISRGESAGIMMTWSY